jgi:RNA polymerase sigma factor (sigma-70 family)
MLRAPDEVRDPEEEALEALARGDRDGALSLLMDAYGAGLYRYCRQMIPQDGLAEDVHQTVFVQAYEALERFSRRSTLRTWLYGIARHRCLDALKARRRHRARFEAPGELPEPPQEVATPEEQAASGDRARALERCLAGLAPKVRSAVVLRFQEGFSYGEMAALCRERAPTLQARVARALPALRRCLEQMGLAP